MDNKLTVLITGAASGIGRAVAEKFIREGHTVYAVDRSEISDLHGALALRADITSEADMKSVYDTVSLAGNLLDIIINVAGIHTMASFIEADYAVMKKVLEVNLMGTILVNLILHPLLDKNGRIVIVTSEVAPLDPMPFNGLYNVSKTALDCYAQSLRQELNLIDQKVITIRPGAVATPLSNQSLSDTDTLASKTVLYKSQASRFHSIVSKFMGKPIEPSKLGDLIYKASLSKHPRVIYNIHRNPGLLALSILPKRLQCFVIKFMLK